MPVAKGIEPARVVYLGDRKVENAVPDEPGKGCGLCVVEVEGEADLIGSCGTEMTDAMVVATENDRITARDRRTCYMF